MTSLYVLRRTLPAIFREFFIPPRLGDADESIDNFVQRRYSPWIADNLASAIVSGIYAGDSRSLSTRHCLTQIWEAERNFGSVGKWALFPRRMNKKKKLRSDPSSRSEIRFPPPPLPPKDVFNEPLFSFDEGLEFLPRTLYEQLKAFSYVELCPQTSVEAIIPRPMSLNQISLSLRNGVTQKTSIEVFDHVISTVPASALANMVESSVPQLAILLREIKYSSVGVVNMGFKSAPPQIIGAFGYLVPRTEKHPVLGVSFDSKIFPLQNQTPDEGRITVMLGGTKLHENSLTITPTMDPDALVSISKHTIKDQLGITKSPDEILVTLACDAIPQYHLGFSSLIDRIMETSNYFLPGLLLCGTSFGKGVGINDAIAYATQTVQKLALKNQD
jgi:oxygen-dependent protoporphyrinogen oxidase